MALSRNSSLVVIAVLLILTSSLFVVQVLYGDMQDHPFGYYLSNAESTEARTNFSWESVRDVLLLP